MFPTEENLVNTFISHLGATEAPWRACSIIREFDYVSGRTDVLSLSDKNVIIAFEAKLTNWRKAIHQAWRNTSFANQAYVVLPRENADAALKNKASFVERGVGLCVVDEVGVEVIVEGQYNLPIMPWLNNKAMHALSDNAFVR